MEDLCDRENGGRIEPKDVVILSKLKISEIASTYTAARFSAPSWAKGAINREDAAFLCEMILKENPRTIAEIGVGSGVSTAFLCTLLLDRLAASKLYAFDISSQFSIEPQRPIGAFLFDVFGKIPDNLALATGIASSGIRSWSKRPDKFDFVFLDANHLHPWPVLDLLSILDLLRPEGCVVLHDTSLPLLNPEYQCFGPFHVIHLWPGEVRVPEGERTNIAAIQLFADPRDSATALLEILRIPWQASVKESEWNSGLESLSAIDFDSSELASLVRDPPLARQPNMRDCEIVVRGANPFSHFTADPTAKPILLHVNRVGEPTASLCIRGISRDSCRGIIFPSIVRGPEAAIPITVDLCLRSTGGSARVRRSLVLNSADARTAYLLADHNFGTTMELEISVSTNADIENTKGAWVRFDASHFV